MTTKVTKTGVGAIDQLATGSVKHASSPVDNITLDANGRVGVGTSSPTYPLTVAGSSQSTIEIKNTSGIGEGRLYFSDDSTTAIGGIEYQHNGDFMRFYTNNTERMRIDSAGRVTMPYKPMFMAYPTTNYSSGSMPTGVIDMTATYDNGNNFNASNDRFTAPINGWYRTTWGGLQLPSTVTSLMINGTRTYNGNHFVTSPAYVTVTQTAIVQLSAGDYLNIEGWNGGGYYSSWYLWTVEHIG